LTLTRTAWTVPERVAAGSGHLVPFHAGEKLAWQLEAPR